jgi:hypothetical protein
LDYYYHYLNERPQTMTTPTPPLPADARERVFAAANALYEQAGRETLPTVDQVRRHARVDMCRGLHFKSVRTAIDAIPGQN